jgi:uncharacterized protein YwqG
MPMRNVEDLARPLATPGVHVIKRDAPSRSHLGGLPSLPAGARWPERRGARLGFLARLSLAELQLASPIEWLPSSGALLFFYDLEQQPWGFDPGDRGGWIVHHVPDLASPGGGKPTIATDDVVVPHRFVGFRRVPTLPVDRDAVRALELSDEEADAYHAARDAPFHGMPQHQVGGFPAPVQGDDMELECQLVSHGLYCGDSRGYADPRASALAPGAADWRLLFQLDSDDELDLMWGDSGMIYFWVREQEARAGDFSGAWLVLQCS